LIWTLSILLMLPIFAWAQVVTASFDRTTLSINPASATTRGYNQVALFSNLRTTNSDATDQQSGTNQKLEEKITSNKTGVYFTGHGKLSPELYISKDSATKTFEDGGAGTQKTKLDMVNNFINLGILMTRKFSLGITFYKPSYTYKENLSIKQPDNSVSKYQFNVKNATTGLGFGATYNFQSNLYLGGYYTTVKETNDFTRLVTESGNTSNDAEKQDNSLKQYGFGLSYLRGTAGRGSRFELAYSRMDHPQIDEVPAGEEIYSAVDFSGNSFTFGGHVKFRKNAYFDHIEVLDYIIGEQVFSESYKPSYGGFLSYGHGKGHSIGISGLYYKTVGERQFFGTPQNASIKVTQVTFNYAYLF
jgi:hypothetical protein